jgi:hypothetical protein
MLEPKRKTITSAYSKNIMGITKLFKLRLGLKHLDKSKTFTNIGDINLGQIISRMTLQ